MSRSLYLLAVLVLALMSGACQPAPQPQTRTGETPSPTPVQKTKLSVATLYSVTNSQVFVAKGSGLFEKNLGDRVDMEIRGFPDGNQIMTAFRNGELDMAYVGSVPTLLSYLQKPNLKIIGGTNVGGTVLLVRGDSGVSSVKDLKGKTVAVPGVANFQDVVLRSVILGGAGLKASADPSPDSVTVVTSTPQEMLQKLKEKSVDGVIAFEPWPSRILLDKSVNAKILVDWDGIWRNGQYPSSVLIASTDLISKNRDLVKRFLHAHVEASLVGKNSPQEAKRLLFEQIKAMQGVELPMEVIDSGFPRSTPTYDPNATAVMEFAQLAHDAYPSSVPSVPKKEDIFDLSILNEVLKEKGLPLINP